MLQVANIVQHRLLQAHRQFRTMGLRHMVVVDSNHAVVGMITRKDMTERRLDLHWYREVKY